MSSVSAVIASPVQVPQAPPQVANVDTTTAPAPQTAPSQPSQDGTSSQNQISQSSASSDNNNPPTPPLSSSIYTAVASVNAPTIRGTSVNVVT